MMKLKYIYIYNKKELQKPKGIKKIILKDRIKKKTKR